MADEARDRLARLIADALVDRIQELVPVSFLVYADDMARLVSLIRIVQDKKHQVTDSERQRIHDVLTHVWNESRSFTQEHMDMILHGIELAEKESEAKEAAKNESTTKTEE